MNSGLEAAIQEAMLELDKQSELVSTITKHTVISCNEIHQMAKHNMQSTSFMHLRQVQVWLILLEARLYKDPSIVCLFVFDDPPGRTCKPPFQGITASWYVVSQVCKQACIDRPFSYFMNNFMNKAYHLLGSMPYMLSSV